jgi:hypothetical protein
MDPSVPTLPAANDWLDLAIAAVMLFLYFFPAVVASVRNHARVTQITLMNVLFGWTGIGWAIALRMALEKPTGEKPKAKELGEAESGEAKSGRQGPETPPPT